jgi:hypothetical protein
VFDVADIADGAAAMVEAVAGRAARMVERYGADGGAVAEMQRLAGLEADMLHLPGQLRKGNGEEGR